MEVDASTYAVGAILFQTDDWGCKRDIGYYSKALNPAERNYDIWDREFLAVIKALGNWRHLLIGTPHKIIVWTDHMNLQYYRQLQKVNQHMVRGINFIAEFLLELQHIAGKKNRADPLSRRSDHDDGSDDNEGLVALPDSMFIKAIETTGLDQIIVVLQQQQAATLNKWTDEYNLCKDKAGRYHKGIALVVLKDMKLCYATAGILLAAVIRCPLSP
jgi:RNase H-like domain found in reverse transcriptase